MGNILRFIAGLALTPFIVIGLIALLLLFTPFIVAGTILFYILIAIVIIIGIFSFIWYLARKEPELGSNKDFSIDQARDSKKQ
jgi:hypothetical protein